MLAELVLFKSSSKAPRVYDDGDKEIPNPNSQILKLQDQTFKIPINHLSKFPL